MGRNPQDQGLGKDYLDFTLKRKIGKVDLRLKTVCSEKSSVEDEKPWAGEKYLHHLLKRIFSLITLSWNSFARNEFPLNV